MALELGRRYITHLITRVLICRNAVPMREPCFEICSAELSSPQWLGKCHTSVTLPILKPLVVSSA